MCHTSTIQIKECQEDGARGKCGKNRNVGKVVVQVDENNPKPIEYDGIDWIYLALEVEKWRVFENTLLILQIASNAGNLFTG